MLWNEKKNCYSGWIFWESIRSTSENSQWNLPFCKTRQLSTIYTIGFARSSNKESAGFISCNLTGAILELSPIRDHCRSTSRLSRWNASPIWWRGSRHGRQSPRDACGPLCSALNWSYTKLDHHPLGSIKCELDSETCGEQTPVMWSHICCKCKASYRERQHSSWGIFRNYII